MTVKIIGGNDFLNPRWVLFLSLLIVFSIIHYSPVGAASPQSLSIVYLNPVSYNSTVGSSFTVNVMLNLAASQNVSGFDVKLHYDNPLPNPVVRAQTLSYSGNIFGNAQSNFVSQECVPGGSAPSIQCETSDPTDKQPGWVHFAALPESGNPVIGPLTGLLFSVTFSVDTSVRGSSLVHVETAFLGNTGSGPFATTQFIPVATEDAVFSNSGITAFFNYLPTDTATIVSGHTDSFDATGSFNADNPSVLITNYAWNFDDGNPTSSSSPAIWHTFRSPGSYNVTLTVTDANGGKGSTHRVVVVGPALGALLLTVYSLQKLLQSGVLVRLFNLSIAFPFANATTSSGGQVTFNGLSPGDYKLAFSGKYVKNARNVTETVFVGWTTQDSVGIEVDPPPSPPPWYGDTVFLVSLGGAMGIFGLGLFLRRRNMQQKKKLRANRTSFKKR